MKILMLRFKNLNSLVGEWEIDFTHPQYSSDGIFAISGSTGAGKSTILDAICLALYGRTPRLDKITTSTNEIMSRRTKECFAEVVFESNKGRFKCHWSQTRANKTLKLQSVKFEISDDETGNIIASQIKETSQAIVERTGMDFNRFTQSMLLAQGGFAKFLLANANERAPILEEITGTEIYREISKHVFERAKSETAKLDLIKSETEGIRILSDEEVELLDKELTDKRAKQESSTKDKEQVEKSINWLQNIEKLKIEIQTITQEEAVHQLALEAFVREREILNSALRAYSIEAEYVELNSLRTLQNKEKDELKSKEDQLPELNEKIKVAATEAEQKNKALTKLIAEWQSENKIIADVRKLDVQITNASNNLGTSKATLDSYKNHKAKAEKEIEQLKININKTVGAAETAKKYLEVNKTDELLNQQFEAIKLSLRGLDEQQSLLNNCKKETQNALSNRDAVIKKIEKHKTLLFSLEQNFDQVKKTHEKKQLELNTKLNNRPLSEYRNDLEHLTEKNLLLQTIKSLEEHRKMLKDGKECPLCGSVHHPFAEGNIPQVNETESQITDFKKFIAKVEAIEKELLVIVEEERNALKNLNDATNLLTVLENDLKNAKDNLESKQELEKVANGTLTNSKAELQQALQLYGSEQLDNTQSMITSLQTRLLAWNKNLKTATDAEATIKSYEAAIATQKALLEAAVRSLAYEQKKYDVINAELIELKLKRTQLYSDKNPATEELRINKTLDVARINERNAATKLVDLRKGLENIQTRMKELGTTIKTRETELERRESNFRNSLIKVEFTDEADFVNAQLKNDKRDALSERSKNLDNKSAEIETRKSDRLKTLDTEQEKMLTDKPSDSLQEELIAANTEIAVLLQSIGAILQKIEYNERAKKEKGHKIKELERQQLICKKWEALNVLIGQADGAKFSRFAQGITFEIMVAHANRQLRKLTDRYLLVRDTNEPLDLNIIDNYQAGECRSTKNLSGGESFIVSLALALGLSSMSGKNVKIDSLFLDEGFGSLDEDTLEVALEALTNLKQEDKLIGVISHVNSFKERINTRIEVVKGNGGISTIVGPGCSSSS